MSVTTNELALLVACGISFISCNIHSRLPHQGNANDVVTSFEQFHTHFRRPYRPGTYEYLQRFKVFKTNLVQIEKLNSQRKHNDSALYGITKFSDLTQDDFNARYLSGLYQSKANMRPYEMKTRRQNSTLMDRSNEKLTKYNAVHMAIPRPVIPFIPFKLDLRDKNVLGPVRNQKACGGCWAFSVVETTETVAAMNSHTEVPLSVQEVIDCSLHYDDSLWGCKGGDTCHALKWLKETQHPLVPAKNYPLTDSTEPCQLSNDTKVGIKVADYTCENLVMHENKIQQYVATKGPVSVSVDATTWNNYMGGIIQFHCGQNPNNHAVVIVGYDTTGDIPYYIVKNSWGSDFGDNGYMYIMMGNNVCGIAEEVSTVKLEM